MSRCISFVIPTLNEGNMLRQTVESLKSTITQDYEIVIVDNGSTDGSTDFIEQESHNIPIRLLKTGRPLGTCNARNFGAAFAEGDFIFNLDGHMLFQDDWATPIIDALSNEDVGLVGPAVAALGQPDCIGFGMTWTSQILQMDWLPQQAAEPYPVPFLAALCHAFRWDFFHDICGYDSGMSGYGFDEEICLRTWLLGKSVLVVPGVAVEHKFRSNAPYEIKWSDTNYNALRTMYAHFSLERINRVLEAFRDLPDFDPALQRLNTSDIWIRRRMLELKQKHDDNWFCERFGVDI